MSLQGSSVVLGENCVCNIEINFTLEPAAKAHKWNRCIALFFL